MLKGKAKKFLCFLLSAVIVLSLFAMNISAAEEKVASIGNTYYNSVADALAAAVSGDTVIVQKDTTIRENVEVKSGVTLLVPYKAGYTGYSLSNGTPDTSTSTSAVKDTLYRTLTVAEGVTMTVNGNILVSALLGIAHGGSYRQEVNGPYAQIVLNGKMNVQSGGIVCANGYIKGSGAIEAFPGGEVRDLFVIEHWRGGTHASSFVIGEKVWVANEYDFRNIEVELTIHYGAKLVAQSLMYFDNSYNHNNVPFVSGSDGIFVLNEGGKLVRTVEHRDRIGKKAEVYKLYGGGYIGSISMTIKASIFSHTLNSSDYVLSMDGDNEVHICSGTLNTYFDDKAMSLKLLPGCEFIIHDGAKLSVDRYKQGIYNRPSTFVAYRELTDEKFDAIYRYPQGRPSAKIKVLNGGQLYVDGLLGGEIHLEENAILTKGDNAKLTVTTYEADALKSGTRKKYVNDAEFFVPDGYHATGWINNQYTWEKHTYSSETFTADCEKDGYTINTCTVCGYKLTTDVIPAYGHTIVIKEAVKPTCTESGLTEGKYCSDCGKVFSTQTIIRETGHNDEVVTVEPTCTEQGYTKYTCLTCGDVEIQDYTDPLGHNPVTDEAVEPTCTENGYTEGSHCENCNEIYVAQEVIPALGHIEVIDNAAEPDCENTGLTEGKHCERCEEVLIKQKVLPALGHVELEEIVEATCTENGHRKIWCDVCDVIILNDEDNYKATGHNWEIEEVPPTDLEHGYTKYTCLTCNYSRTDYIDPLVKRGEIKGSITSTAKTPVDAPVKILLVSAEDSNITFTTEVTGEEGYTFENLLPGKYTMIISQESHATRKIEVDLAEGEIALEDVRINLYGDVTADGTANTIDVARANAHAKGMVALKDYDFVCADVNGDGKLNTIDVARINAHAKGTVKLW